MAKRYPKRIGTKNSSVTKSVVRAKRSLVLECLEDRSLLSAARPWPNPAQLTVSFAPDGTQIAGDRSTLFETLGTETPGQWQQEILRAFQSWAEVANINFTVIADNGEPFGSAGPMQGDARFGDIRIGARSMPRDVISLSVRPDPLLSQTWSGDILLNSSYTFGADADLFAVMFHEVGHALGLHHSSDAESVMFSHVNPTNTLSAADISTIQSIYGVRSADRFDSTVGNGNFASATKLEFRDKGSTPLALFGDITSVTDEDVFSMRVPENYRGPATFRLVVDGVSLLPPRLSIYDSAGRVLGEAETQQNFGGVLTIQIPRVLPKDRYYVRIEAADSSEFAVGSYGMAVTLDNKSTATPELIDSILQGPYRNLAPDEIGKMLRDPSRALSSDYFNSDEPEDESETAGESDDEPEDESEIAEESDDESFDELFHEMQEDEAIQVPDSVSVNGVAGPVAPAVHDLFIAQPQLFHFALSVPSVDESQPLVVQSSLMDQQGNIIASWAARSGATISDNTLFLVPGYYSVVLISVPSGGSAFTASYTLTGANITDPIGPRIIDPAEQPITVCPNNPGAFCYPGGTMSAKPFFLSASRPQSVFP